MARKDAEPLLKDFMPVKIDTDRMTGGKEVLDSYPRGKGQGLPWFVFLDPEGKELADSNGPKGNIGCPNTDEEIDAFIAILRKAAATLTDEDLAALRKSLVAHRETK